jgi:hypothetical protein
MMNALGVIHRTPAPAQPAVPAIPPIQKSKKISEVIALYSEEKAKDNNKETIKDKEELIKACLICLVILKSIFLQSKSLFRGNLHN